MDQVHKMNDAASDSKKNQILDTILFFEQVTEFPVFYRKRQITPVVRRGRQWSQT